MIDGSPLRVRLALIAAWWAWMPLAAWLFSLLLALAFPGMGTWRQWWQLTVVESWFLPGGGLSHAAGLFFLWLAIGMVGTAVIVSLPDDRGEPTKGEASASAVVAIAAAIVAVAVLVWPFPKSLWDNDKDAARFYNTGTVFHRTAGAAPSSLNYLLRGARTSKAPCPQRGGHDVPSCIQTDTLDGIKAWEGRSSSYASAQKMMSQAAGLAPKTDAWDSTLTYLYGQPGKDGIWTSVIDGSGKATPAYGIATWDGRTNNVSVGCRFNTGKGDRFDRAFDGQRGNSLRNLLAEKYPALYFDDADVWGYCNAAKPVIVIPVTRQTAIGNRTVDVAAGILTLTGGTGGLDHTYRPTVKPGELPGPVYPISMVERQRQETQWAAGRKWKSRGSFGFTPTIDEVQGSNTAEYLLRGPDQRLYYVTPLTPNASKSQAFIAYSAAPADQVTNGSLNRLDVHVLPDGDQRVANLNTLTNKATEAVRQEDPTFLNTGGKLEEFTPLGADMWRVFGVRRGLTEFYVDLSIVGTTQPKTVRVSGNPQATAPAPGKAKQASAACTKPTGQMNAREIADCMTVLADELRRRNGGQPR